MNESNDSLQSNDYVILFQPVLVPRQAIQSLSLMPLPVPSQLPQQSLPPAIPQPMLPPPAVPVEPIHQEEFPVVQPLATDNPRGKQRIPLATDRQMEWVQSIARKQKLSDAKICEITGSASLDQMTKAQASAFIKEYQKN